MITHRLYQRDRDELTIQEGHWDEPNEPYLKLTHPHGGYMGPEGNLMDAPDVAIELYVEQAQFIMRVIECWLRTV